MFDNRDTRMATAERRPPLPPVVDMNPLRLFTGQNHFTMWCAAGERLIALPQQELAGLARHFISRFSGENIVFRVV